MKTHLLLLGLAPLLLPVRHSHADMPWPLPLETRIRSRVAAHTSFTVDQPSPKVEQTLSAGDFGFSPANGPVENTGERMP